MSLLLSEALAGDLVASRNNRLIVISFILIKPVVDLFCQATTSWLWLTTPDISTHLFYCPCFWSLFRKNDPYIRIPVAFTLSDGVKLSGKNGLDLMAFGGQWAICIPAVFWQTGRYLGVFSTGTETDGFTGFRGRAEILEMRKEAWIGRIQV